MNNNLKHYYRDDNIIEIGVDEVGRGPMFGRVYSAAVILPKDESFDHSLMKDSKKFYSKSKIKEVAEYIKKNSLYWSISWCSEDDIDKLNILNATFKSMHSSINKIIMKDLTKEYLLLIDGNNFKPFTIFKDDKIKEIPNICVKGGDNKYTSIAAASILAKVERDNYIDELINDNIELNDKYDILKNKGYGTKKHIEGIKKYGISKYHRKTFGICKNY